VTETPEERFDRLGRSEQFEPKGVRNLETRDFVQRNGRWVRKVEVAEGSEKKATTNGAGSDGSLGPESPPPDSPEDYGFGPNAEQDALEQAHAIGADHANFENSPDEDADDNGLCEINIAADKTPIPPRQWLLGSIFCLGYLSSLIGEGGVGKTAVRLLQWLSVATGRNLLGDHVFKRMPVLIICLEDDYQEIRRRLKAAPWDRRRRGGRMAMGSLPARGKAGRASARLTSRWQAREMGAQCSRAAQAWPRRLRSLRQDA
jgi:hypothetical protein